MADLKISQLTDGGASQATDEYVIARSGANYRIDGASVAAAATSVGTLTSLTVSGDLTVDTSTLKVDSANNRVGVGTASPGRPLNVVASYTASTIVPALKIATVGGYNPGSGTAIEFGQDQGDYPTWVTGRIASPRTGDNWGGSLTFSTNDNSAEAALVERMRLDASGNLGVGTSSPTDTGGFGRVVDVQGSTGAQVVCRDSDDTTKFARLSFDGGTTNVASVGAEGTATQVAFRAGGGEKMRLDASGNLGLGVTPSAWGSAWNAIQLKNGVNLASYKGGGGSVPILTLSANAIDDGSAKYVVSDYATQYSQYNGQHIWYRAASGTAGNAITFTQAMTLDASGNLGLGTTSPAGAFEIVRNSSSGSGTAYPNIRLDNQNASGYTGLYFLNSGTSKAFFELKNDVGALTMGTGTTERARITSGGILGVGVTNPTGSTADAEGMQITPTYILANRSAGAGIGVNRKTNDGDLVIFYQADDLEGSISVSGNTVSYNAFAGSHWSQLEDGSKPEILRGTVMEALDELCEWPGEQNERLPKAKVSDTAGSKKVYGVFMDWDNDWTATNDMYVTAVGAFICRVAADVVVEQGDLLESNGDGTARVQADDVIRSSTIGKVTSTVKTHQYEDGTYCVPTVLYCG